MHIHCITEKNIKYQKRIVNKVLWKLALERQSFFLGDQGIFMEEGTSELFLKRGLEIKEGNK